VRDRSGAPPPGAAPFPDSGNPSGAPPPPAVPFPELWNSPDAPTSAAAPFPELRGAAEPAPPAHSRGSRLLRMVARVVLWSLVVVGALRGLLPATDGLTPWAAVPQGGRPAATSGGTQDDHRAAAAVAVAFLREYLTVGEDQAARATRLGQFGVAGADLRGSVAVPAGVSQYADLVVAAGGRSVAEGVEITVLAHVLQLRSGAYRDGGTLAFVVPLVVRQEGIAVTGRPRPTSLPVGSGVSLPRPPTAPADLSPAAERLARQAVVALVNGDRETLARLGGGRMPATRSLPTGWRTLSIGTAEVADSPAALAATSVAGSPGAVAAMVPVRVRPPTGPVSYVVPVLVRLDTSPRGLTVRQVDAGGSP
jgi:hypothetical protein